jgi:hypothetical protein
MDGTQWDQLHQATSPVLDGANGPARSRTTHQHGDLLDKEAREDQTGSNLSLNGLEEALRAKIRAGNARVP